MSDLLRFTFSGNTVTAVFEVERDGSSEPERIEANESYVRRANGDVVKTETYATYREVKTYADSNGDGIFARISEVYTDLGGNVIASENSSDDDDDDDRDDDGRDDDDSDNNGNDNDDRRGTTGDDRLFAGRGDDTLRGAGGRDLLNGGFDDDDLFGDDGDDDLFGEDGDDSIVGGAGDDDLFGGDGDDDIEGGDGNDNLEDGSGDDNVSGGAGDDTFVCGLGRGKDTYRGGDGVDDLVYEQSTASLKIDLRKGSASGKDIGSDRLADIENVIAGTGSDKITGTDGANLIDANAGDDQIDGRDGDDTVIGGAGSDRLSGGKGADTFVFLSTRDSSVGNGRDQIRDLRLDDGDRIDLTLIDADIATTGDQAFTLVSAFTGRAGQLVFRDRVLAGDVNGDGRADFEIGIVGTNAPDISGALAL